MKIIIITIIVLTAITTITKITIAIGIQRIIKAS